PSPEAEALVTQEAQLLVDTYGDKGREILADAQAYADGINAYWAAHNINQPPATVNDIIAVTAFIGSIFGAGGGGEAANADLLGPGINAQGAAVPGLAMYILIGRTPDYAWSLTSAGHDVRDVFAEKLCEPDGSPPTRASTYYSFDGQCRSMDTFTAGKLGGT